MKFKIQNSKLQNFKLLATCLIVLLFAGCESQEDFVKESGTKINSETVSFKTLFSKIQNKKMSAVGKNLFQQKNTGHLNRSEEDFIQDIDTTTIEKVEIDGKESYTLRIITQDDTENKFYNMVLYEINGVFYTSYIKYEGIDNTKEGVEKLMNSIKTAVDENGVAFSDTNPQENRDNCSSFIPIWQCSNGNAHSPDDAHTPHCSATNFFIIGFEQIGIPCGGDAPSHPIGGENPSQNPTTNPQYGGSGSSGTNTSGNPVYTIPVTPIKTFKQIKLAFTAFLASPNYADELDWWLALPNKLIVDEIVTYLTANQTLTVDEQTPFGFALECINQMVLNPNVFTSIKPFIIEKNIDDSQLDPCSKNVLAAVKNTTVCDIAEVLAKLNANNSVYNTTIKTETLPNGNTSPAATVKNSSFNYTIYVSPDYTSKTKLFIASLIIHEMVHAYFLSIVDDYNSNPNNNQNLYNLNSFPSLFQAYCDKKYPPAQGVSQNIHHLEMANYYVDAIARSLQEYQTGLPVPPGSSPIQVYTDLAWAGLNQTPIFDATYPIGNPNRDRILNSGIAEQIGADYQGQPVVGLPCN